MRVVLPSESLSKAVKLAGGQAATGRLLGVSQAAVWKWISLKRDLPAEHVLKLEAFTGVSRHDLRPDLYPHETATTTRAPGAASLEPVR